MKNLKDVIVLVTGGTSGYGKATAKLFTENGAKVIVASRKEVDLKATVEEGTACDFVVLDVTKPEDWDKAKDFILGKYGRLDMLINNAGGGVAIKDTVDQSIEDINNTIMLNLNSCIYGCRVFGMVMKNQNEGTIINVSSACAKQAWPSWSVYAAAKWGMLGFSKGLYVELQPYNVRVTCLIPGAGESNFQKNCNIKLDIDTKLTSEDVANSIANICALPQSVVVEEMTVWGVGQVVVPL